MKKEFNRSIFETSLSFENYILRNFPDEYNNYILSVEEASNILQDKEIVKISDTRYSRMIGGYYHEKVMMGTIKERY